MKTILERWGWINPDDVPNAETHDDPNAAIKAMKARIGEGYTMADIERIGFRLARMNVTIEPAATMTPNEPAQARAAGLSRGASCSAPDGGKHGARD